MDRLISTMTVLTAAIACVSGDCTVGIMVDNSYEAFVDGISKVFGEDYAKKTNLLLPASTQVLAIAAHNNQGASGFMVTSDGDIYTSNTTGTPVKWKCVKRDNDASYLTNNAWAQPGFDDSSWPVAFEIGDINTRPWVVDRATYIPVHASARWLWTHNPGYNSDNDFEKPYSDGDIDILCRGTFSLIADCQLLPDTTTVAATTTKAPTTVAATTTQAVVVPPDQAASSDDTGLSTTTIVLLALLGAFILALIIGLIIFCCCCRQGGAVAVKEKGPGIYNGRPVAHVPVHSKLGDTADNYFVESDGSTSNLVALPKDTYRNENGYYY